VPSGPCNLTLPIPLCQEVGESTKGLEALGGYGEVVEHLDGAVGVFASKIGCVVARAGGLDEARGFCYLLARLDGAGVEGAEAVSAGLAEGKGNRKALLAGAHVCPDGLSGTRGVAPEAEKVI
jgi:hypothetical protein